MKYQSVFTHKSFLFIINFCIASFLLTGSISAQSVTFNNVIPDGVHVCNESSTFTLSFTNTTGALMSNLSIDVDFPTGVEYVSASINEATAFNVQEQNINNLSAIQLSANDLPVDETITFDFEATAGFDAYVAQLNGNVFMNTISLNYNNSESIVEETDAYNILYPALSVTVVDPMSANVFVGETYTRTVTVVNGGYGSISSFEVHEIDDANLQLNSVDMGLFDVNTGVLILSETDFVGIGNQDEFFDQNESITFTQTITAVGCNSAQSEITAYWGCNNQSSESNTKYPYTSISLFPPNLVITPQPTFNTCMESGGDTQELSISNTGTGPANETEINIFPIEQHSVTEIDVNSISYTLNGNTVSLSPTMTNPAFNHTCFGADPIDGFTVNLPTILPGETLTLNWDNLTCAVQTCGAVHYIGWEYEAAYTDMCNSKVYDEEGEGQAEREKGFSTFYESPSDLVDGQTGTYSFIISSATFNLPEGTDPYFEAVFDIPEGLIWSGNAADLTYESNVTNWAADQLDYDPATKKLTAKYNMPIPDGFYLNHSVFNLDLTADCTPGVSWVTVGNQLFYTLDTDCGTPYRIPMTCYENPQTQLHCPGPCAHGLGFQNFEVNRISFGNSDNDLDGLPDSNDNLDFSKVKTNRVMKNDTFETVFTGSVKTSNTFPTWSYGYARSAIPYGNSIVIHAARVSILDASTGNTLVCDNVSFTEQLTGDTRYVDFDFSPTTLAANGCNVFSGFVLEQDDQVILTATYELVENLGGIAEQVMIQNDFYVSDAPNGTAYQCNDWNGNVTLIGYYYASNWAEQYDVRTCTKTLSQTYKMSIGTCCTNYAGGNMFPYEYRNWSHLKTMTVDIPAGYAFVSGYVDQWRTTATNASAKETAVIFPDNGASPTSSTLDFDMENYLVQNGGTLNLSDDGYNGKVYITLQPECTVNQAANNPVTWTFDFQENDFIGGEVSAPFTYAPDYIKYYRSKLDISSTLPTQEGIAPTVTWNIKIRSKKANAANSWFHLNDINNSITILEVVDLATGNTLNPINGFYQMGDLSWGQNKNYQITASYNSCNLSQLDVVTGHDCDGYPTDLASYSCASESFALYIAPQPSELQVKFNSYINSDDECSNIIGIELEMLSSKLAGVNDLNLEVFTTDNQSISIQGGSMEVLYPASGVYTVMTDPVLNGSTYNITGMDLDAIIGNNGLVGVTDINSNIVKLKFNILLSNDFQPGDLMDIDINAKRPCGNPLPTLALTYDPNASFGSLESIGLDDATNNWGAAWGDYDNDGFVDLFVTDYEPTQANLLYHNNGDGTFTKITTGAIATDMASSLAATWGDYDNDGDLDLYVANNIGFANFLYRNNGNGTFTKIQNDPIVNDLSYAHGAAWVDYDNDGHLDMFVTDYFSTKFNQLYHNNGDGTFVKETNAAPVLEASNSVSAAWGDYNNDGLTDLFVANTENQNNSLYENRGDGNFLKVNQGAVVTDGGNSVGGSWGDYDNDGDLDLFVANAGNQDNFLYNNTGNGAFVKVMLGPVVNDGGHSHGSAWADYDNDGDLDLFVSNDQGQDNFLYSNNGDGTFIRTTNQITQDNGDSFGAAWADFDNDGDVDLFIANHNANENFIYENERGKCQSKSCIVLTGTSSNRSAIGTKVYVKAEIYGQPVWQMREISAQTGGGIGGQNELKTIFGLGNATTIDSIIIDWNSGYRQVITNANINDCISIVEEFGSQICGTAYYDENENCVKDEDEAVAANVKMIIQPGNRAVLTDQFGNYEIMVEPGTYTISEDATGTNWVPACALEQTVEVTGIGNTYCGNDFANQVSCNLPDLKVDLSATAHRVGFENLIALTYTNDGGAAANNVSLTVAFGDFVVPMEASIPWDLSVGTDRRWNLGTLEIGESATIYIKDYISTDAIIGEDIQIKATLYGDEEDCDGLDNIFTSIQPAVGAIDPNDISVSPEGYIDAGDELVYKIRFQNVGNATVSTVRVEDELPAHLDINSFQQGVASHAYSMRLEGNKVIWTFDNINMPDSTANEPESHGFIIFKIKTKASLPVQTVIENRAGIFFDFQAPVITNTVTNIIGSPASAHQEAGTLAIYPNPLVTESTLEIMPYESTLVPITAVMIYDMLGKEVYREIDLNQGKVTLSRGLLNTGYYVIKVLDENGIEYADKLFVN